MSKTVTNATIVAVTILVLLIVILIPMIIYNVMAVNVKYMARTNEDHSDVLRQIRPRRMYTLHEERRKEKIKEAERQNAGNTEPIERQEKSFTDERFIDLGDALLTEMDSPVKKEKKKKYRL